MDDTSQSEETRADIKTRWKKGQSGNPKGRLKGSGDTVTWLARTLLERPIQSSESGARVTRLAEYMSDLVRRADAGDVKCRMFLIKAVERGDRRKEMARRNAKKAKSEELRQFEEEMAAEISTPIPPLAPEVEEELTVKPASPAASASAKTSADAPKGPARSRADASTLQRNPLNGRLVTPEGRELSWEEEERLLYPTWPHISPHLKKEDRAGVTAGGGAGESAGLKTPAQEGQAVDSTKDFDSEKISPENPLGAGRNETLH
jgi:hypothetical protein